jgi:hypothetical protein
VNLQEVFGQLQPILLDLKSYDRQAANNTWKTAKRIGYPTAAVVGVHVLVGNPAGAIHLECDALLAALEA